jgi:GxxExxY protein
LHSSALYDKSVKSAVQTLKNQYLRVMIEEGKYKELTGKIIGCAMAVHSELGCGFQEVIYQRALEIEFRKNEIACIREFEMDIFYKGEPIGTRRVDFLIEGKISVELKALTALEPVHLTQAINYLEAYNLELGLLLNFGSTRLEFKRLVNSKYKSNGN